MAHISFGDTARDQLRMLIAVIEGELAQLPAGQATLRASWRELVAALAIGPSPETRVCPTCGGVGFRAASRCSTCWAKLEPLPAVGRDAAAPGASS
jgi:hypothetical protein